MTSKIFLILAGSKDKAARSLAGRWASFGARLLVPRDLSERGWRYQVDAKEPSFGVADGRRFDSSQIGGVLVRLPRISAEELPRIEAADRVYVATEITAFLAAWLSSLHCLVLNRPVPACLFGPNWKPEHWVRLAAQLGLPVRPMRRVVPSIAARSKTARKVGVTLSVVGNRCFGVAEEKLKRDARRLAHAAEVDLLTVRFDGPRGGSLFLDADPRPDLSRLDAMEAVLELLTAGPGGRLSPKRVHS